MSSFESPAPKSVVFELAREYHSVLVQIFPHDTTESITTTIKNFYGLSADVTFQDVDGKTLIPEYENVQDKMIVYVRDLETLRKYLDHMYLVNGVSGRNKRKNALPGAMKEKLIILLSTVGARGASR
ncbi:hypothetical protein BKA61DRAFT_696577 [Leptodontidium sp. MPI-SDFR-AT-0119]|nr:hypothetical protein BKA61DRAFT_696577 [Leptodontidium sp. MPI-SDFR-AT-0119]